MNWLERTKSLFGNGIFLNCPKHCIKNEAADKKSPRETRFDGRLNAIKILLTLESDSISQQDPDLQIAAREFSIITPVSSTKKTSKAPTKRIRPSVQQKESQNEFQSDETIEFLSSNSTRTMIAVVLKEEANDWKRTINHKHSNLFVWDP